MSRVRLVRRPVLRSLVGAALLVAVAWSGPDGGVPARGGMVPQSQQGATLSAACAAKPSAARVLRGPHHGQDPNSVTAVEAQRADARLQAQLDRLIRAGQLRPDGSLPTRRTFRVRTHVHVITREDGTGGVTARQIRDQVRVMNDAFAGETAAASARTPFSFTLVSVDVTRNDDWYDWRLAADGSEDRDAVAAKTSLHRGGWADLNIYVAGLGDGLLGYATFPQDGVLELDGLVLLNDSLPGGAAAPYNEGDTATHEIGHWLGLFHTFENGCAFPGDYVADTPYQLDGDNIFSCDESDDTCPRRGTDPVHNFMSYGDDPCLDRFTRGQDRRMIGTWLGYRA
jgi:hypothetical protein